MSTLKNVTALHRYFIREPAAEFLGTMVLIMFGMGVDCQVTLSASTAVAASQKGVSLKPVVALRREAEVTALLSSRMRLHCSDGVSAQLSASGPAQAYQEVTSTPP